MDRKERLQKAWRFEETDRVPIEMFLTPSAKGLAGADIIFDFQENEADNFRGVPGFEWGFIGLDTNCHEEVIEDVPGEFKRIRKTQSTPAGEFTAVTRHTYDDLYGDGDPNDYHWEKRFFETVDDLTRIARVNRDKRTFNLTMYNQACLDIGNRGIPCISVFHPLGALIRNSNMAEVYMWMLAEEKIIMEYLERCTEQIIETLLTIKEEKLVEPPVFRTAALEMLIPPWLGREHFNKLVFPFDKRVNDVIHTIGGRHRAHCHGRSGEYLELFADMGIDSVEPLEPPPYGDNILKQAKKQVGKRMLLSGNIPSQVFALDSFKVTDIRSLVKQAIDEGAPGGGFTLRTTGSAHIGNGKTRRQKEKSIQCGLAIIDAWREFG